MLILVLTLARDKWTERSASADTRDTQKRLDGLVTFCTGVLVGFLGRSDFSQLPQYQPPNVNSQTSVVAIDDVPIEDWDTQLAPVSEGYISPLPDSQSLSVPSEPPLQPDTSNEFSPRVGDPGTPVFAPRPPDGKEQDQSDD